MGLLARVKSIFGGDRLDVQSRFELLREAIHGTMSKFYQARDRDSGRIVGLKVLNVKQHQAFENRFPGLDKPSEGEIAQQLTHPAIVRTFESGLTTKNEPYLVMEYIEGQGLNTLISTQDAGLQQRLKDHRMTILRQAAEAVAAVHAAGFIHRDVCPRNFVVSPSMEEVKLIDFGLTLPDEPPYRKPGNRTGTPRYMAPEIVKRRPTDRRVDIFSFGVTAFELFAGEPPWPGVVTGQDAVIHASRPAAELSERCQDIDSRTAAAIQSCLAADPARRPQSMEQFLKGIAHQGQETGC